MAFNFLGRRRRRARRRRPRGATIRLDGVTVRGNRRRGGHINTR